MSGRATLGDRTVGVLAAAAALAVANNYYVQPLLADIGASLGLAPALDGLLPALGQVGLACGLFFVLPLGDVVPARRLLLVFLPLQIAALLLFAAGGSLPAVAAAAFLVGLFGIVPYVLPPYVSLRVPPARVGRATGMLARGVIIGILLARTVAGIVGTHLGWRAVYAMAAILMAGELVLLLRIIRPEPAPLPAAAAGPVRYRALLASLGGLLRATPELRTAAAVVALSYGSFIAFWLGATLYLASPAVGWSPERIGLVALVAAAAASAAPLVGKAADRFGPAATRRAALAAMALGWCLLALFRGHLLAMGAGLVVLDLGATVVDISNRTILYRLDPRVRTRLNAVYQVAMFAGGAAMSIGVGPCWAAGGWLGVCALGAAPVLAAAVLARRAA